MSRDSGWYAKAEMFAYLVWERGVAAVAAAV